MKRFLLKAALLFTIVVGVIMAGLPILPDNPHHYMHAQRAKIARLDTLSSPRIVIVGGSNAAFGFNCKRIEDSLNINVANTALQALIGLKFMMRTAIDYAQPGDIFVILPEYPHFQSYEAYRGTPDILAGAVVYSSPRAWSRLDPLQIALVVGGLPKHYLGVLKARKHETWGYDGENFNSYGDETAHWSVPSPGNKETAGLQTSDVSTAVIEDFITKIRELERRGCKVSVMWPTTIRSNYVAYLPVIERLTDEFAARGVAFANSPQTFIHDDALAFDTRYHMSFPAVEANTDSMISRIATVAVCKK